MNISLVIKGNSRSIIDRVENMHCMQTYIYVLREVKRTFVLTEIE